MPPLRRLPPDPYDFELAGNGYLKPSSRVMRLLQDSWYKRESITWFPERQQTAALSEQQYPARSELPLTIRDRSYGFGYTDMPVDTGQEITLYAYTDAVDAGAAGDGQGVDCSVPFAVLLGPNMHSVTLTGADGAPSGSFELTVGGTRYLYMVAGTKLFRSSDGVTFSAVQANLADLPAALTGQVQVFQGAQPSPLAYFPLGTGHAFVVWDGDPTHAFGTAVATSTTGYQDNNKVIDFRVVDDRLFALGLDTVAATQAYRINCFFDGLAYNAVNGDPSWLPSVAVSDRSDPAQTLMLAHDTLYVGCNQSLRTLDDTREALKEVLWTTDPNTNNFRWWTAWRRELWLNAQQGTYRLRPQSFRSSMVIPNMFEQIGPEHDLSNNRTPVRGSIRAIAGDDYCVYGFLRTETGVTYLMKFRNYDDPQQGQRHAWHVILRIGTYDVDYATVSTVQGTNPILYFGTGTGALRYIILPVNGFYPHNDPNYEFCAKGALFETRLYGGLYFINKNLIAFTARAEELTATETLTPAYRTDANGTFTDYGGTLTADPGQRLGLPQPISCAWWENRVVFTRGATPTTTPILLSATYSYVLRPNSRGQFTVYALLDDYQRARNNLRDRRSAADIEEALIALDGSQTVYTFRNRRGTSYDVLIDDVRVLEVEDEADRAPVAVCRITATEFSSRAAGTHNVLDTYTNDQLDQYTHDQLLTLP